MAQTETADEPGAVSTIRIDGVDLPLAAGQSMVQFSDLARFQPKLLFGDPSKDDNDLLSSWQISNLSGGSGVMDLKEGTDQGRFAHASMYTRFPGQLTKPPYAGNNAAGDVEGTSGDKYVLGEYWNADDNEFYVAWQDGDDILRGPIDSSSLNQIDFGATNYGVINTLTTLAGEVPVGEGVAFQGLADHEWLFIPYGNAGYAWINDNGAFINQSSVYHFSAFTVWDHRLIGITTHGRMYWTEDPDEADDNTGVITWTAYDLTFQLSKNYRIRNLVNYFDRGDKPCVFVVTDRDVWQFDPDGPELFRIDFGWPSHPHFGRASCNWQGEFYISVGMGVWRYEGGSFVPMGLDRDNGLPTTHQGYIRRMVPGFNGMYALVQSDNLDEDEGGISSIQEWNGTAWHQIWQDYNTTLPPRADANALRVTGLCLTGSALKQTLVFSTGSGDDHLYTMPLLTTFANPRSGIKQGQIFGDGAYYYIDLGEFDADMMGYIKIANAWQIYLEEPISQTPAMRDDVILQYKVDREDNWQTLTTIKFAAPGRYAFALGEILEGTEFQRGLPFEIFHPRVVLKRQASYNADKPTIITNMVISFLKTVSSSDAYGPITIDCSQGFGDKSPAELAAFIDGLTSLKRFTTLQIGDEIQRVFVSSNGGFKSTGDLQKGTRQLQIVQIPDGL